MGECEKIHSAGLKEKYEEHVKSGRPGLEHEWYEHLKTFTAETDRKIQRAEKRMSTTQDLDPELMNEGLKVDPQPPPYSERTFCRLPTPRILSDATTEGTTSVHHARTLN